MRKSQKPVLNFPIVISQDEDGVFVADCPAIPGCHSQGETYEEAEKNIREVITLCLKVAEDDKAYRSLIDFGISKRSRLIGITEVSVPQPLFV